VRADDHVAAVSEFGAGVPPQLGQPVRRIGGGDEALGHGGLVRLAAPHDMPARLLDVTGVSLGLPIHANLADALTSAAPPPSGTAISTP
jgi:hypothetical protein